ncbi:MAG: AAA family ATPase, partial [Defluviitaleaceae bacterium]|nr:AAA family ATPase [Defluviitaleaceae bacterium]
MKKLAHTSLKRFCDPAALGFETTASLDAKKEIIGQARAAAAFDFGLGTRRAGYNIYVAGIQGSGKTTFAAHFAKQVAQNEGAPPDLAYVYNFKEPKTPKLLTTKPGLVATFKEDLQEMIEILTTEIPKVFEGDDYEQSRNEITKKFDKLRDAEFKAFSAEAKKKDFDVRVSEKGMSFAPIVDGKTLDIEDYEALSSEEQDDISERSSQIQEEAYVIIAKVRQLDAEAKELIKELDYKTSLFALGHQFSRLQEKYGDENCILEYLSMLKEDILENMHNFLAIEATEDEEGLANALPWIAKKSKEDAICKYKVNIIADNGGLAGAPVHVAECGTYAHIMGEIEYDSEFGNLTTDYMKIKPGLLHKANGGYLILQAKDVLATPFLWENLKRTLKTKEITIENPREHQAGINVTTIRPAPVPFDTKIILVGGGYYLDILRHHDEDFADLFKVSALFDYEMPYNDENILE